jgi:RNA polymerase sigma factor (sigma-70 family)
MQDRNTSQRTTGHATAYPAQRSRAAFEQEQVGELIGRWTTRELTIAKGFRECRGLPLDQLEDLYQETAVALLTRPYMSEEHLRNALRLGVKHRALNLHRDQRRRRAKLEASAPVLIAESTGHESQRDPESSALSHDDQLVVAEFLSELTGAEQSVFWLTAEGMRYRAIAPALGIHVNEARKLVRSCERKRERFQLLYNTGRLCGFRSSTITALQNGDCTNVDLARRAFAHIERCSACRTEHKTNARKLMRSFNEQATALLPLPALLHSRWATRVGLWVRGLQGRLLGLTDSAQRLSLPGNGGAIAKLTTAGVLAVGGLGAAHALHQGTPEKRTPLSERAAAPSDRPNLRADLGIRGVGSTNKTSGQSRDGSTRRAETRRPPRRSRKTTQPRGPATAGLDYLGVAANAATPTTPDGSSGGPFSP